MEITDKDIEKLDWILDRLIEYKSNVSSNDLHNKGFYDDYKDNQAKIDSDFDNLKLIFKKLGVGFQVPTKDGDFIGYDDTVLDFKNTHKSFSNYFQELHDSKLKEEVEKLKIDNRQELKDKIDQLNYESLKHKETIREQEDRIRDLTERLTFINLLKAYWWVISIGFTIGGIIGGIIVEKW
ncbi:hypothetical protein [Gelidibacter japonicus]|uniref:hypothetical protein n=1 Tax=Gelidibacter japonicus TaxID=1962232 RepID=UPI0013D5335F|nr:hypothetical protein [Gelidibacter japonicus]